MDWIKLTPEDAMGGCATDACFYPADWMHAGKQYCGHCKDRSESQAGPDYRCKSCGEIVPRSRHHKMMSCRCGNVLVDRGWYGARVLWAGGPYDEAVEKIDNNK